MEVLKQAIMWALPLFVSCRVVSAWSDAREKVRPRPGRWLAARLELEPDEDILRTTVAPTWTEIRQPGAIVMLWTALNFFLQQEIDRAWSRRTGVPAAKP